MRPLDPGAPRRILVRGTNWVGDAVMTLPALAALDQACPQAAIQVLAKPWVAAVYESSPAVARVVTYDAAGGHAGWRGKLTLAGGLRREGFDWAVLMQNAFEAAALAWLARIPTRMGYDRDGRRLLLSHPVPCGPEVRSVHETSYYLHLLRGAGLPLAEPPRQGVRPRLAIPAAQRDWARQWLYEKGLPGRLIGVAPGAAFGPAKIWPARRYAATLGLLTQDQPAGVLLFGSPGEAEACAAVERHLAGTTGATVANLAGRTDLAQALALLAALDLFLTNDSGLMHAAAALGVPTVAVFGSTNPEKTGPLGPRVRVVHQPVDCSPCLQPQCKKDLRCFAGIHPEQVAEAARQLIAPMEAAPS